MKLKTKELIFFNTQVLISIIMLLIYCNQLITPNIIECFGFFAILFPIFIVYYILLLIYWVFQKKYKIFFFIFIY